MAVSTFTKFDWKKALNLQFNRGKEIVNSKVFSLTNGFGEKLQVQIRWGLCIYLFCQDFGQNEELKLTANFWIESGGNKVGECEKQCVFKKSENANRSEDFLQFAAIDALLDANQDDHFAICFDIQQELPVGSEKVKDETPILCESPKQDASKLHSGRFVTVNVEGKTTKMECQRSSKFNSFAQSTK